jgi:hypothetical protein
MSVIDIQFRKLKGEIICVFPYTICSDTDVMCYAHVGQHSACDVFINNFSKPATKEEYKDLLAEVTRIYSDTTLRVIKRRNHSKYLEQYYKVFRENKTSHNPLPL